MVSSTLPVQTLPTPHPRHSPSQEAHQPWGVWWAPPAPLTGSPYPVPPTPTTPPPSQEPPWSVWTGYVARYSTPPPRQTPLPTSQSTATPNHSTSMSTQTAPREAPALQSPTTGENDEIFSRLKLKLSIIRGFCLNFVQQPCTSSTG